MSGALVLNASFEPLCVVSDRRAIVLVLKEKAEVLDVSERCIRSERASFALPSVIRLIQYVRVPIRPKAAISRRAVFARDQHRCQYCFALAQSIDHVIPRSKGGRHVWENVVACCTPCNTKKSDKLLDQTNLMLGRKPSAPHSLTWVLISVGSIDPLWEQYLGTGLLSPSGV